MYTAVCLNYIDAACLIFSKPFLTHFGMTLGRFANAFSSSFANTWFLLKWTMSMLEKHDDVIYASATFKLNLHQIANSCYIRSLSWWIRNHYAFSRLQQCCCQKIRHNFLFCSWQSLKQYSSSELMRLAFCRYIGVHTVEVHIHGWWHIVHTDGFDEASDVRNNAECLFN